MMDVAVPANMHQGLAKEQIARRGWAFSADEAKALIGKPDVALIDLRDKSERRRHGEIPGALHLSYRDLQENISPGGVLHVLAMVPGKTLLFYCAFAERSAMAVQAAQDAGLSFARHIEGGIDAWKKAGVRWRELSFSPYPPPVLYGFVRPQRLFNSERTNGGVVSMSYHNNRWAGDLAAAIGNTPLIRLRRASEATGCTILGKAEFMNPGGSVKDRAGLAIITDAEQRGTLEPGGIVVEGTAGNTGIGLTLVGNARGYRCVIVMPETQSQEKISFLRMIGADLRLVPAKPYRDPGNYVHVSRRMAEEMGAVWANQFDNLANREGHRTTTGPEIWDQTDGKIDAFTCACGTGGTLAGVAFALKERNPKVRIVLADPEGSALHGWVKSNDLTVTGSSITEGIGQSRVPENLNGAPIDDAERIPDPEALTLIYDLLIHEGLSVGTSSGINVAAAIRVAKTLGPGHTVVTMLCDGGSRYQSKLFNPEFLRSKSLPVPDWLA